MTGIAGSDNSSFIALGQRRGVSDVARFALDLAWADKRAESGAASRSQEVYPSPPMSGSPPLPPKSSLEAGSRSQAAGPYQTTSQAQDVYGGTHAQSLPASEDARAPTLPATLPPPPPPPPPMRPYQPPPDAQDRMGYYRQPDDSLARSYSYPPPGGHQAPPPPSYPPMQGPPAASQSPYGQTTQAQPAAGTPYGSPKPSRKAKGHVPSACVPCKRAHLRCDTQRPCSRCVMNGKEDACVDVQHKKRGRPRLRDDRETRFDASRFPSGPDAQLRRPLGMSYPGGSVGSGYEDTFRRSSQSYRVLKSQPSEPMAGRYLDRASSADANVYAPPLSIATRLAEPVAYLTTDLDVVKASISFMEATGVTSVSGRKLYDLVVPAEREKAASYQRQMQEEQARQEPRYLPPIYGKQETERVIQGLGFTAEELSRFQLDRQDRLTFSSSDGQQPPRAVAVLFGLAKVESIYLIVVRVNAASRFPYPSPSPHSRDAPYSSYPPHPPPPQQQQTFTQRTPVSATFDPSRPRYDQAPGPRAAPGPSQISSLSPGVSPGVPSYQPSPSRPDYAVAPSSYQTPRSELPPTTRPPQAQSFQLPPIRAQPAAPYAEPPSADSVWQRDDPSGTGSASASASAPASGPTGGPTSSSASARVDIGGLMNQPEQPPRPQ